MFCCRIINCLRERGGEDQVARWAEHVFKLEKSDLGGNCCLSTRKMATKSNVESTTTQDNYNKKNNYYQ